MHRQLFQDSVGDFREQKMREAVSKVESLPEPVLTDPKQAGILEKIADQFKFDVATLNPRERRGKRRVEWQHVKDFGEVRPVEVTLVDVSIPYHGRPERFQLSPNSRKIVSVPADVQDGQIIVSFPDDDNLDKAVDQFI